MQVHASFDQLEEQRASFIDQSAPLAAERDSERSDNGHIVRRGTTSRGAVVKKCPSLPKGGMRIDLRFAKPQIPMLDAGRNRNIGDAVSFGPLQSRDSSVVFLFAVANFFDNGVWNQQGRGGPFK